MRKKKERQLGQKEEILGCPILLIILQILLKVSEKQSIFTNKNSRKNVSKEDDITEDGVKLERIKN